MSERRNRVLGDFYFPGLLKWQTWEEMKKLYIHKIVKVLGSNNKL